MKVIIAGSRTIDDYNVLLDAISMTYFPIDEVVSGAAKGVDSLGEKWAIDNIKGIKQFPADWDKYGKSAGYKRNVEMAEYADALLAIWDGVSVGTKHMIDIMLKQQKPVFVYFPE